MKLLVLKKGIGNVIQIEEVQIEEQFVEELSFLHHIYNDYMYSFEHMIFFVSNNPKFLLMEGLYKHCFDLSGAYQGFTAKIQRAIEEIESHKLTSNDGETMYIDSDNNVFDPKYVLLNKIDLWKIAYQHEEAYKRIRLDKSILAYSHCINGWSNPLFKLTEKFSVEIKTNFGYGRSSYFYVKIIYDGIELYSLHDIIRYRFIKTNEIINYTKAFGVRQEIKDNEGIKYIYKIESSHWDEAMAYVTKLCNQSLADEKEYFERYITIQVKKLIEFFRRLWSKEIILFENDYIKYSQIPDEIDSIIVKFDKATEIMRLIPKLGKYSELIELDYFINEINETLKVNNKNLTQDNETLNDWFKTQDVEIRNFLTYAEYINVIFSKYNNFISNAKKVADRTTPKWTEIEEMANEVAKFTISFSDEVNEIEDATSGLSGSIFYFIKEEYKVKMEDITASVNAIIEENNQNFNTPIIAKLRSKLANINEHKSNLLDKSSKLKFYKDKIDEAFEVLSNGF
jgi:hypothetical protein